MILDLPTTVTGRAAAEAWLAGAAGLRSPNAAAYLPQVVPAGSTTPTANAGAVAGAMLRMELAHGVWKAPSGTDATLAGPEQPKRATAISSTSSNAAAP